MQGEPVHDVTMPSTNFQKHVQALHTVRYSSQSVKYSRNFKGSKFRELPEQLAILNFSNA